MLQLHDAIRFTTIHESCMMNRERKLICILLSLPTAEFAFAPLFVFVWDLKNGIEKECYAISKVETGLLKLCYKNGRHTRFAIMLVFCSYLF